MIKIVIFEGELQSEMKMYLALSNRYKVEIANDMEELMDILDHNTADITLLDIASEEEKDYTESFKAAQKILKEHPDTKVVGICDELNDLIKNNAEKTGITEVITRPIKNRDLFKAVEK